MQTATPPVGTPGSDGTPPFLPTRPYQGASSPSTLIVAFVLIALGALFLAINLFGAPGEAIFLVLGAAFAFARVVTGRRRLGVPAGILLGFGGYVLATTYYHVADTRGAWFFLFLGLGFVASYLISADFSEVWHLVPAAVLLAFSAMLFGWVDLVSFAQLSWLQAYWPVLLIVFGLWIIGSSRLPAPWRRPLFAGGLVVAIALGMLVVAGSMAYTLGPAASYVTPIGQGAVASGPSPFAATTVVTAPMTSSDTLHVINRSGNVTLRAGASSDTQLRVQEVKRFWSYGVQPNVTLTRDGSTLTLETVPPIGGILAPTSSVDYTVDLPGQSPVNVEVGSGTVQVAGATGDARVTTGSGNIHMRGARAPATLRTGSGDIRMESVQGQLQAWTGSGSITGTGLQVGGTMESGSGSIHASGIFGSDLVIHTGSGDITVQADPASSVRVNASTGSGQIRVVGLPLATQQVSNRSLTGTLGAGAGTLRLQTGSGDITLQ